MKVVVLGGAGFIGTNLAMELSKKKMTKLLLVDEKEEYFVDSPLREESNVSFCAMPMNPETDFAKILKDTKVVYHLISTINPTSSNYDIGKELQENVAITVKILEACVGNRVEKIVFLSSGGTIYGEHVCPISEEAETNPINTYGIQKLAIEKIIYLYHYLYGLDYRIVRLSNPYGPYQRPNGKLGAITTFTYKAMRKETINIYGDGTVVRDYIYIDDAIRAIVNICDNDCLHRIYNVGSGKGYTLLEVIQKIEESIGEKLNVCYEKKRKTDLEKNYLDISRYEKEFGKISLITLEEGISRTMQFLKEMN